MLSSFFRRNSQIIILDHHNLPTGGNVQIELSTYIGRFPFKKQHLAITASSNGYSGMEFVIEKDKINVHHVNYVPLQ